MTINRGDMGRQLKGNKMKKSVKKKAAGGLMGVIPMAMRAMERRDDRKRDRSEREGPSGPSTIDGPRGMKRGGKVTRGDGACMKGHTKGKMR